VLSTITQIDNFSHMTSNARLDLQFDVEEPIEIYELTSALSSFGNQYQKFVDWKLRKKDAKKEDIEEISKLFITKVESNCIITEFAAYSVSNLPAVYHALEHAKIYVEYAKYFNSAIKFFAEKHPLKDLRLWKFQRRDHQDWANIIAPAAKRAKGKINLSVKEHISGDEIKRHIEFSYESPELRAAEKSAIKHVLESENSEVADHKSVLMHMPQMHQTKVKKAGKTSPDLGIIESIFRKELPVFWLSDMDAQRVKSQKESPFNLNYVVDVNVQTVNGIPRAYRILRLLEILQNQIENGD